MIIVFENKLYANSTNSNILFKTACIKPAYMKPQA